MPVALGRDKVQVVDQVVQVVPAEVRQGIVRRVVRGPTAAQVQGTSVLDRKVLEAGQREPPVLRGRVPGHPVAPVGVVDLVRATVLAGRGDLKVATLAPTAGATTATGRDVDVVAGTSPRYRTPREPRKPPVLRWAPPPARVNPPRWRRPGHPCRKLLLRSRLKPRPPRLRTIASWRAPGNSGRPQGRRLVGPPNAVGNPVPLRAKVASRRGRRIGWGA